MNIKSLVIPSVFEGCSDTAGATVHLAPEQRPGADCKLSENCVYF